MSTEFASKFYHTYCLVLTIIICRVVAQCEDLKLKYIEEQTKRKKLYNQIQEAKGILISGSLS